MDFTKALKLLQLGYKIYNPEFPEMKCIFFDSENSRETSLMYSTESNFIYYLRITLPLLSSINYEVYK